MQHSAIKTLYSNYRVAARIQSASQLAHRTLIHPHPPYLHLPVGHALLLTITVVKLCHEVLS